MKTRTTTAQQEKNDEILDILEDNLIQCRRCLKPFKHFEYEEIINNKEFSNLAYDRECYEEFQDDLCKVCMIKQKRKEDDLETGKIKSRHYGI